MEQNAYKGERDNVWLAIRSAQLMLVTRLSSAEVERSFSVVKAVGDHRRSSMAPSLRMVESRSRLDRPTMLIVLRNYLIDAKIPSHEAIVRGVGRSIGCLDPQQPSDEDAYMSEGEIVDELMDDDI